jgi:N-acetylglucosaminyldiphosphoundecaprenol N-acetyl-beta-D-mannosaminyltransferase
VGVGAAFDLMSGTLRQAPRWMQRIGLEWLFRLTMEPRRLWRRYLLNIPRFVVSLARRPPRIVPPPTGRP